ncbi:hypothetical protein DL93DRAFT_782906 [Clavulina sp. PMI_390]|nr:hypothetical protein DL93DRAFT_782906 [Clavulina sp. PMI_390]
MLGCPHTKVLWEPDQIYKVRIALLGHRMGHVDGIQELRKSPANSTEYCKALRALQDACYDTVSLPATLVLEELSFDRRHVLGKGGEATVYKGRTPRGMVAVREIFLTPTNWESTMRRTVTQVAISTVINSCTAHHLP